MFWNRERFGQRTEVTSPFVTVGLGMIIVALAILAFAWWPDTETVRTGPTANLPDSQKALPDASPPKPN